MKINQTTKIVGDKIILVPYRKHHVEKYHEWMKLAEIQKLTASEPLTLEEEYKMQMNWQIDEDKLTFIVLRRDWFESFNHEDLIEKEKMSMIGDVNVFISAYGEDDDVQMSGKVIGELDIMIPELENRGNRFGIESISLMINYSVQHLQSPPLDYFIVKINEENLPSIKMFEKLGFKQYKHVKVFQEVCLKMEINEKSFSNEQGIKRFKYFTDNYLKFDVDTAY